MSAPFTFDESLKPWNVPIKDWLQKHGKQDEWDGIATACVVFNSEDRVLLIQRASHDSMPDRWETPGGAVDDEDATILHGAARELWEEAGLVARHFRHIVTEGEDQGPAYVFQTSSQRKTVCRFTFSVEVENHDRVTLDPNEHQDFLWVSAEEVVQRKVGDREIAITHHSVADLIVGALRIKHVAVNKTS